MSRRRVEKVLSQTKMLDLPVELTSGILQSLGIKSALSSLPANNKLHKAWQAAVEYVRINASSLHEEDIKIIAKLVNLKTLRFQGPASQGAAPVWRVAALSASQLTLLTKLVIMDVAGAFDVLKAITCAQSLANRLIDLTIRDENHKLCPDDLLGLVHLKALSRLDLLYQKLLGSPQELSSISSRLSQLEQLSVQAKEASATPPGVLAGFPGQLVSLTSLTLQASSHGSAVLQKQQLISAVSALTKLRQLHSNYAVSSQVDQRQALGQLRLLTELQLCSPGQLPEFVMLPHLPELKLLDAQTFAVKDPFKHPSLEVLQAGILEASEEWRGKTAERCRITSLTLGLDDRADGSLDDDLLQNMPRLPDLSTLHCYVEAGTNGRYLHLAALLRRHASKLQEVRLLLSHALTEAPPRELPVCRHLSLRGNSMTQGMLQTMSLCSLPKLQMLAMDLCCVDDLHVEADLGWLGRLPELRSVAVRFPPVLSVEVMVEAIDVLAAAGKTLMPLD